MGLARVVPPAPPAPPTPPSNISTIASNFNGTSIAASNYIWFNSVMKVSGVPSTGATITVSGATVQFTANNVGYNLAVPDSVITFSSSASTSTTTFDAIHNQWNTTTPVSYSGNVFLAGLSDQLSSALPGGINPVSWTATFYTDKSGVSLQWQWAAAVYTSFSANYSALGVKPIDATSGSAYANSDHAGTPENYKSYVIGGARGGGGSNWTGSYSGTVSVTPQVAANHAPVANAGPNQTVFVGTTVQLNGTASHDPDGLRITYSWSFVSIPAGSSAALSGATGPTPTFLLDKAGNYTVQLIVSDGELNSAPSQVVISTKNSPPVANAGPNQTVTTRTTVQLNGSGSSDVDGDPLTYRWTITSAPQGSTATLSNPNVVNPSFVTNEKGTHVVQLIVNDGTVDSAPSQVTISDVNSPPVANAGPNQTLVAGTTVQLNGSGSTDIDGDPLTYSWAILSAPQGSTATLSSAAIVNPTFFADKSGTYVVQLIVNDGTVNGQPSTVTITSQNAPPVANAGPNQTVTTHTTVQLDGSKSTDVDGDPLTYHWSIVSAPQGSTATLSNPTIVNPTFITDEKGTYVVQLIVNDGTVNSAPTQVTISDVNSPPVSNPGPNQTINVASAVHLDGSHSTDVDGDPLTYSWAILSTPSGSSAALSSTTAVQPTFVADRVGTYVIQLIVNDGTVNSQPGTVTISTNDVPPVANPGPSQSVTVGTVVTLNGSGSTDSDGQPLSYKWALLTVPAGSTATLSSINTVSTSFTADLPGNYVVQLIVNDGYLNSAPATVTISTNDVPPVANPGPNQSVSVGATVQLDGTASTDSDKQPLTYRWAILSQPTGGNATLSSTTATKPTFVAAQPGLYVVQLIVNDGFLDSSPVTMTVTANRVNQPPAVSAGPNQTIQLPTNTVTLQGTATDDGLPNGTLTISWTKVSGPGTVTFSSPSTAVTQATFNVAGVYVLQITANDSQLSSSAMTTVTVHAQPVNQPPVVSAGPNQMIQLPTNKVTLQGTATDDGLPNGILIVTWSEVAGPDVVNFGNPSSTTSSATFPAAGVYLLRLTASDTQLSTSSDVAITVKSVSGGNQPPTVSAGSDRSIVLPANTLTLTGEAADDGLPIGLLTTIWTQVSGPVTATIASPNSLSTPVAFVSPGTYSFRLTASDSQLSSSSLVTVVVYSASGQNQPPSVNAGPDQTVVLPTGLILNGVAVDDGLPNGTLSVVWQMVSGPGTVSFSNSLSASTTAAFSSAGEYVLSLSASDSQLVSTSLMHVHVLSLNGARTNKGTDFWLAFPTNYNYPPQQPNLYISSETNTTGVVSVPGLNFSQSFTLAAGASTTVTLPANVLLLNLDPNNSGLYGKDLVQDKGIHVTSMQPVTISGIDLASYTTDGYLALPTPMLGTDYITVAYRNVAILSIPTQRGSDFAIVAPYDGTTVTITPSTDTQGRKAGVPYNIVLNQGHTYELINDTQLGADLSGTIIHSDKPVAVFGGHWCANIGNAPACNELVEQIPPTDQWGNNFVSTLFATRTSPYVLHVIASQDSTNVAINGQTASTLDQGRIYEALLTQPASVTSDKPILVAQYAQSAQVDSVTNSNGDPTMVLLQPITGYMNSYRITVPTESLFGPPPYTFQENYTNISILQSALSSLKLDGVAVDTSNFVAVAGTVFSTGNVALTGGGHLLSAASPFGAIVYGFASFDAYSFPAGISVATVPNASLALFPPSATQQTGTQHCAVGRITDSNGVSLGGIRLGFGVSGPNAAQGSAITDFAGIAQFCYAGAQAGTDTITASVGNASATANVTWNAGLGNQAPYVNAGPTQTILLPQTVTLPGIATDDGLPSGSLTVQWSVLSGPGTTTFTSATSTETQATFSAAGTYQLQLSASDSQQTSTSQVTITVNTPAQNQPPVVSAGPNQTLDLNQQTDGIVTLSGSVTDDGLPSGTKVMASWIVVGCQGTCFVPPQILAPTSAVTQVYFSPLQTPAAVWTFQLTGDDTQLTSSSQVTVTVVSANRAPTITSDSATPQNLTLPANSSTLTATVTDDGLPVGVPLTYKWTQIYGPATANIATPTQLTTQVVFNQPGTYEFQFNVSDSIYTTTAVVQVFVNPANQPPVVSGSATPATLTLPASTVTLNGTATDDGNPPGSTLSYTWAQTSGPAAATIASPNQLSTTATFTKAGFYLFTFTASDSQLSTSVNVFVSVQPANQPPVVNAGPNLSTALPNASVTLNGTATDDGLPAGSTLTVTWSEVSGPALVTFSAPNSAITQASFTAAGTYDLRLSASDTQYTTSSDAIITVTAAPQNQPPTVFAGLNQTITLPSNSVFLNGTVTDDGLPVGGQLTSRWSELSGPAAVTFGNAASPQTNASFTSAGTYVLQLSASDSQLSSSSTVTILVIPAANQPPIVSAGAPQFITLPTSTATLTGTASDDGLPFGTLTVLWAQSSGPVAATIATPNQVVTQVVCPAVGTYIFTLLASDGQFTSSSQVGVIVSPADQPPVVNAGPNQTIQLPTNTVTLTGSATQTGSRTLTYQWSEVYGQAKAVISTPNQATTQVTFSSLGQFAGSYAFQLAVSDGQFSATSTVNVTVNPASAPPMAQIITPADGDEITKPFVVTGNVSPVDWVLEYSPNVNDAPSGVWTQFARSGQSAVQVNNTTLGTFDSTSLANGSYTIRLTATNQYGQFATSSTTVTVARNMKVGVLQLAFNDLTVPVAGVPMQVIRSYNSLDRNRSGDFGNGWSLAIANIRLQKNHVLGKGWTEDFHFSGQFPVYCLQSNANKVVSVVFPDGKTYSFQVVSGPECQSVGPISAPTVSYTELPGSAGIAGATLVSADGGQAQFGGSIPGTGDLLDFIGQTYNPTLFVLTTADGTQYTIDEKLGLTKLVDRFGNTLTISANGIVSSTGKSITFIRDAQNHITEIDDPNGNRLLYSYNGNELFTFQDAAGQLTRFGSFTGLLSQIYPPGQFTPINFTFDGFGKLIGSTDPLAGQVQYTHDIPNQTETIQDRNGNTSVYQYDGDGNVVKVTDALGHVTTSTYDGNDNKLTETNAIGKTTAYTYDGLGNRTSETDPLGHATKYTFNGQKQPLTITDANGNVTTNTYDPQGNLLTTKDPLGNVTTNTYASNGLLSTTKDALSNTTSFGYDTTGHLTSQTDALSNATTYTYDANGNRKTQTVTRTKSDGIQETLTTQYQYDANNRLTKTTVPNGTFTQIQYDSVGRQSAIVDAKNQTISYTYDLDGRVTQTSYPDSTSESTTYDANGNRLTSTDRAGHKTTFAYDKLNRLTATAFADNSATSSTYDAIGEVLSSKDANGNTTQYAYDAAGRRTSITDALAHTTTFAYDASGNQLSVTDANSQTAQYVYDTNNRRTKVIYPDTKFETTGYDALGRVTLRTDAKGLTTQYGYDALGRLTSVTDALNQVTSYAYDEVGNRITQADANSHSTKYAYDQRGRRVQRKLPLGQTESYAYDNNGNLSSRTDFNGRTTTYGYDTVNHLLSKTADAFFVTNHLGTASVSFTYNALGQRATMTDASGTSTYTYDNRNRLTTKATPEGTLSYTYDAAGDVKTIQSSNAGGANLAYTYDGLNRLSTVTDANGATAYTYDNVGNLAGFTYPNGVAHSYSYDARNRLTNVSAAKGASQLAGYSYLLDASGHRLSVTELSGRTVNYGYDNLYRLTSEAIAADPNSVNGNVTYSYDAVGNRTQKVSTIPGYPGGLSNYNANDQLSTDTYDADGNTTVSNGLGYAYDFENHLVQQAGLSIVYDGDGNRVAKTTANGTTQFLVDTQNPTGYAQVVDEVQSGSVSRSYTWGLELISEHQPINSTLTTSYYVFDGHGSVRALTSSTSAVTDTYDYDAFGNLIHSTGTTPNNYLFAGEQFDPDLGLYFNRARYLNTNRGRFWSMDTDEGEDEAPLSLHKFDYAQGDPVGNVDPSGNQIDDIMASFGVSDTINAVSVINYNQRTFRVASTISSRGVEFIKLHERLIRRPYNDGGTDKTTGKGIGNCTIGYGHLLHYSPCTDDDYATYPTPLSDGAAEQFLFEDINNTAIFGIKHYVKVPLAQKEFDALADLTFNIGPGNLARSQTLKILNLELYSAVPNAIIFQNILPGSRFEKGLRARRQDEADLWVTGIYRANGKIVP